MDGGGASASDRRLIRRIFAPKMGAQGSHLEYLPCVPLRGRARSCFSRSWPDPPDRAGTSKISVAAQIGVIFLSRIKWIGLLASQHGARNRRRPSIANRGLEKRHQGVGQTLGGSAGAETPRPGRWAGVCQLCSGRCQHTATLANFGPTASRPDVGAARALGDLEGSMQRARDRTGGRPDAANLRLRPRRGSPSAADLQCLSGTSSTRLSELRKKTPWAL